MKCATLYHTPHVQEIGWCKLAGANAVQMEVQQSSCLHLHVTDGALVTGQV